MLLPTIIGDYDFIANANAPLDDDTPLPGPRLHKIVILPKETDVQAEFTIAAVTATVLTIRHAKPADETSETEPFNLHNLLIGSKVVRNSPDFYADWKAANPDNAATIFEIEQQIPKDSNPEQRQAYLFGIRGCLGGFLNL